jgi:hypothetical protein
MNRLAIEGSESKDREARARRFGFALAVLAVVYIGAIIAFIVVY